MYERSRCGDRKPPSCSDSGVIVTLMESPAEMWQTFLESRGETPETTSKSYTSWYFGDSEEMASDLADLVLAGTKRATAGALEIYELEGEDLPMAGDYSVITDFQNGARCVIRTTSVEIVPFREVTADFAAIEGEGDGSLDYWRSVHWDFFEREFKSFGLRPTEGLLVVCEVFVVIFPSKPLLNAETR